MRVMVLILNFVCLFPPRSLVPPHEYLVKQECPLAGQACRVVHHRWDIPATTEMTGESEIGAQADQCYFTTVSPGCCPPPVFAFLN